MTHYRWIGHKGLDIYDNTARMHDPLLAGLPQFFAPARTAPRTGFHLAGARQSCPTIAKNFDELAKARFNTVDPKWRDYPSQSPWSHCVANPINVIDPTGEATFYTYKNDELVMVGSDGNDDGRIFFVNKSLGNKISKLSEKGEFYQGKIGNSKNMAEITNIREAEQIQQLVTDGNSDGYERGMYKDENGVAFVSDKGGEVSTDESNSRHSVNPFIVNGHRPKTNQHHSLYYMHIHPINSAHKDFGKSDPTNTDINTDINMRHHGYTGTTFLVGGKDRKINFYFQDKSVLKVGLDQFINFIKNIGK